MKYIGCVMLGVAIGYYVGHRYDFDVDVNVIGKGSKDA